MTVEKAEVEIGSAALQVLIKKKIIREDNGNIKIAFLDEQVVAIDVTSEQKRKAAKERWEKEKARKMQEDADAMHVHKSALHNDAERQEKIREDKRREDERERLAREIFSDQRFVLDLNRNHKGKDHRQAFEDCYTYHTQGGVILHDWEWRQKLLTWLGRVKVDLVKKTDYKI
jgi:hypothetical protein